MFLRSKVNLVSYWEAANIMLLFEGFSQNSDRNLPKGDRVDWTIKRQLH
jgi:hypothetical protein